MKSIVVVLIAVGLLIMAVPVIAQTDDAVAPDSTGKDVMATSLAVTAVVASGVEEREPIGEAASFPATTSRVYCWTVVTGAADSTNITHTWYLDTAMVQQIVLPVKASPWRTWSYKTIDESMVGAWRVEIHGPNGEPLAEKSFTIQAAAVPDSASGQ